jgi:hypothetical protein
MPHCNVLDILVLAANVTNCGLEPAWETILGCFELNPGIFELITALVILQESARNPGLLMMLTKDCQLSSMIKFVMLISFLDSDSSASNSFCSVRCCPIPFQVQ